MASITALALSLSAVTEALINCREGWDNWIWRLVTDVAGLDFVTEWFIQMVEWLKAIRNWIVNVTDAWITMVNQMSLMKNPLAQLGEMIWAPAFSQSTTTPENEWAGQWSASHNAEPEKYGNTTNVNVNVQGANPDDVVAALRQAQRLGTLGAY